MDVFAFLIVLFLVLIIVGGLTLLASLAKIIYVIVCFVLVLAGIVLLVINIILSCEQKKPYLILPSIILSVYIIASPFIFYILIYNGGGFEDAKAPMCIGALVAVLSTVLFEFIMIIAISNKTSVSIFMSLLMIALMIVAIEIPTNISIGPYNPYYNPDKELVVVDTRETFMLQEVCVDYDGFPYDSYNYWNYFVFNRFKKGEQVYTSYAEKRYGDKTYVFVYNDKYMGYLPKDCLSRID